MKEGQDNARNDDTVTMKRCIIDMLSEFDEVAVNGLKTKAKENRGFYHPLTGKLLCPAKLDWTDEE